MAKTGCVLIVLASTLASVLSASACHNGWIYHGNSCYFFKHTDLSWDEAMIHCRILGGDLAEITSTSENHFIEQQAKNFNYGGQYWIGGMDSEVDGEWKWATSQTRITFFDWSPGQPDNANNNENCLEIAESHHWKWNDRPCSTRQGFICEQIFDGPIVG